MTSLFWSKRPSKTLVATVLLFTLLIALLATVFYFRRPIAIKGIEHFTQAQGLQITCLDFSVDWRLNINVADACLTSPMGAATISQATWRPWSNDLIIEELKISHVESAQKSHEAQATVQVNLANAIPKLAISSIEISSHLLLQPLTISLHSTSANELVVAGDLDALIDLKTGGLAGSLAWRIADLPKFIPQVKRVFQNNGRLLGDSSIQRTQVNTQFSFDGQTLHSSSRLNMASRFELTACSLGVRASGDLVVKGELISKTISMDLSGFTIDLGLDNCSILDDYFAADDVPQVHVRIPQEITVSASQIKFSELQVLDKQNANRRIDVTDVTYKTTGAINFNYKLLIKQAIKAKTVVAQSLNFQSQGMISANLGKGTPASLFDLSITSDNNQLSLVGLQLDTVRVNKLSSQFSLFPPTMNQAIISGTITSSNVQMGEASLDKSTSSFALMGDNYSDLLLSLDNQFHRLQHPTIQIQNVTTHLQAKIEQLDNLSFTGETTIKQLAAKAVSFQPIAIEHEGQVSFGNKSLASQHKVTLKNGLYLDLKQQQGSVKLQVNPQDITGLQAIASQLADNLVLTKGKISAAITLTLPAPGAEFNASGEINLRQGYGKYQDHLINNIDYLMPLTFNSAGLQLADSTLAIESIDVGVMIEQLQVQIVAKDSLFRMHQAQGEIFDGRFRVNDLWLDGRDQRFNLHFQKINLAQIVALQEQPGIQVTGLINGHLPLVMDKQGIRVEDGWMRSLEGGKLTIKDNPSFDSVRKQQPELALLENLDFSELESKIELAPDGLVFFDFSIKGNNPVKKQSVNLNYTHQENIFTLLESIRLVKSVEDKVEQKITQGIKK